MSRRTVLAVAFACVLAVGCVDQGRNLDDGGTMNLPDLTDTTVNQLDDAGNVIPPLNDDGGFVVPSGDMAPMIAPGACTGPLTIVPGNVLMYVDTTHSFAQAFTVTCKGFDVTGGAALTIDNMALGTFNGAIFSSTPGASGASTVRASYGSATGMTGITLQVTTAVIVSPAPGNSSSLFGGSSNAALAPTLVYPPDGVLIPPNLNILEFQFQPAGGTSLYRVTLSLGSVKLLDVYTNCTTVGAGCGYTPDVPTWNFISSLARNQTITWTVAATDGKGGAVGAAAARSLSYTNEDASGGLYYWAASAGGIYRYDFGLRGQKAESFYTPTQAGAGTQCVGCHSLSRDGSRMAVGMNIPTGGAQMRVIDVATKKQLFQIGTMFSGGSNFQTLTSTGATIVTTEGGNLTIRDAASGKTVGSTLTNADMPDLSPDDKTIVFARGGSGGGCVFGICNTLSISNGSIFTVGFTGTGFGTTKAIVQPSSSMEDNYYPTFSPDGNFVAFNRSHMPDVTNSQGMTGPGDSYDAADAELWIVPAKGGTPVALSAINQIPGNSWSKWAPFVHHFGGRTILWITFSSARPYGLHGVSGGSTPNTQIWMAAVDVAKLQAGQDPAFPTFWLPFQDFSTDNHIPQWATTVARQPCTQNGVDSGGCPGSTYCSNGQCIPPPG